MEQAPGAAAVADGQLAWGRRQARCGLGWRLARPWSAGSWCELEGGALGLDRPVRLAPRYPALPRRLTRCAPRNETPSPAPLSQSFARHAASAAQAQRVRCCAAPLWRSKCAAVLPRYGAASARLCGPAVAHRQHESLGRPCLRSASVGPSASPRKRRRAGSAPQLSPRSAGPGPRCRKLRLQQARRPGLETQKAPLAGPHTWTGPDSDRDRARSSGWTGGDRGRAGLRLARGLPTPVRVLSGGASSLRRRAGGAERQVGTGTGVLLAGGASTGQDRHGHGHASARLQGVGRARAPAGRAKGIKQATQQ
jgi:hypothetical protein